ncbi:MAG: peptidase M48 [Ignavibacteria bacterium]|nr:peptidase M48 [Ignavibacteria bacterium]
MRTVTRNFALAVAFSITSLSCSGSLESLKRLNIFPPERDIELGLQIEREIRKNPKEYPILQDRPAIKAYVEQIGNKILASSEIKYKEVFAYKYEVINDDSTINAFCTPGGYIYVYTGLIKFLDNEATLAGVIGHEIAHAELRHATGRMTKALGLELLVAVVLGNKPSDAARIGANLFAGLSLLANSRGDETQADIYSIRYMQSTEYYPGAIRFFFEKVLDASSRRGGAFERLLSTHPLPQDRVENVQKMMNQMGNPQIAEANLFSKRYQEMKKGLQ